MKNRFTGRKTVLAITGLAGLLLASWPILSGFRESSYEGKSMTVRVREEAGLDIARPLTGGIPVPEGEAPLGSRFTLLDEKNKPVPCQSEVLATWKDGSARWVLLDFQASPEHNTTESYRLVWDSRGKEPQPPVPVRVIKGNTISVSSGKVDLRTVPGSLLRISGRYDVKLIMTGPEGQRWEGGAESALIEKEGKLRSTMVVSGSFRSPGGKRIVDFRLRASVYAGLTQFYLEPQLLVNADTGMIAYFSDLSLEFVPVAKSIVSAKIGGEPSWQGIPGKGTPVRLFQADDENYIFEGAPGNGSKAPGWVEFNDGKGDMSVALRDFWQQWPKSIEVTGGAVKLGLFPHFREGAFAHMGPWYKHDYLFSGSSYRLREGQTRRWQVWADLSGKGEMLARNINRHLIPAADPQQAIATGEWGFISASGTKGMAEYDTWADNLFEGYCRSIREQRDYGAMNWGDWWGERQCNWGNHEYDTPLHIFIQFARTGDPKYFYVAEQSARHFSEVDIVHFLNDDLKKYFSRWESKDYPSRPGMVHEHSIGHVGGFHPVEKIRQLYIDLKVDPTAKNPYLCLDPFNLGHIFTLGMAHCYLLTGDPWMKESLDRIADNLMKLTEVNNYKFKGTAHSGRVNGWSMLALAGVYKVEQSERCLKAMKYIADDALAEQDPYCGGWLYVLPSDHCMCKTGRHVGEAGFLGAIRLNGLSYYYRLTGDERIPESLRRGMTHLNNDTWVDQMSGWRYTSCPASGNINQTGVTLMALVNSISITGEPEHQRILGKAWEEKFRRLLKVPATRPGLGKSYSTIMYGSPEAMNLYANGTLKVKK